MGLITAEGQKHRYQLCRDEYCELPYCRIYKEGHRNGYEDGYVDGVASGYEAGYAAGASSCSCGG
jgi:hypothetical protein